VNRSDGLPADVISTRRTPPVFDFNELEYLSPIPGTDEYRFNFWGYSTANFLP
jgi:isoamylase